MEIFLSHVHEEHPAAAAIKRELNACFAPNINVFLAEEIELGMDWFRHIREALERTEIILVILSRNSVHRPWVNIEAGYGITDFQVISTAVSL